MAYFDLDGTNRYRDGAATGIGEAIARRLAGAGATVVVADLDLEGGNQVAASLPNNSFAVSVDITSADSVGKATKEALARTGRIDILVNNAGIGGKAAPLWEQSLSGLDTDSDAEHDGYLQLLQGGDYANAVPAVWPDREHCVNSRQGREPEHDRLLGDQGRGLIAFTKSLAKEVATESICVNAVSPAVVGTKILDQLTPQQVDYMTQRIPMRRTGQPEEIAAVVHFLSSSDCSFVTGQCYDNASGAAGRRINVPIAPELYGATSAYNLLVAAARGHVPF